MTIPVSDGLIHYLLAHTGAAIRELESKFSVRLRIQREERAVTAHGLPEAVDALRAALDELEDSKVTVAVDTRSVSAVIGKSGANLKHLRDVAAGADVGLVRAEEGAAESDAPSVGSAFHVYGRPEATAAVAASLRGLISEFSESEQPHTIPADAVPWLVGRGGERIQAFQRENGVFARVIRSDDAEALATLPKTVSPPAAGSALLVLRGNATGLAKARPALAALLDEYHRCNATVTITAAQGRLLVGVGGATVRKLRADTGCQIDVYEEARHGAAEEADEKGSAKAEEVHAPHHKEGGKGRRHAGDVPVPPGHAVVCVRGDAEKVSVAVAAVRAVVQVRSGFLACTRDGASACCDLHASPAHLCRTTAKPA